MDQAWHRFAAEAGEWLRIFVRTAEADTNTRKEQIVAYKMTCARRFIEKTRINACVSDLGIDGEQPVRVTFPNTNPIFINLNKEVSDPHFP